MKKFISILLSLLIISLFSFSGCKPNNNNNSKAEVKLIQLAASPYKETKVQKAKIALYEEIKDPKESINDTDSSSENTSEEPKEDDPIFSEDTTYTFIFKSQLEINFDIKLNNPKNYYIMDFKLTCDEEQIEYYDKEMEKWTPINDIWIRWSGSNNQESRYRLRLPNPEISPDKIKISEMYYSDRTDGTNKTAVNMNNKETYTVYKVEDGLLNCETVSNVKDKYTFKINKKDGVEITKFTVGGADYMNTPANSDGNYEMTADGKIEIEYQLNVKDSIVYIGEWERDIVLFNYNAEFNSTMTSIKFLNIYGTDLQKYCLIERVYERATYIGMLDYTVGYGLQKLKYIRFILVNELSRDIYGKFIIPNPIPDSADISLVTF